MRTLGLKLIILFTLASSAFCQEEAEYKDPFLEWLRADVRHLIYKKNQKRGKVAGEFDFTSVDIKMGGLPFTLSNDNFASEGEETRNVFTSQITLYPKYLKVSGTDGDHFSFKPPIPEDSFLRKIQAANIIDVQATINKGVFLIQGEKINLQSDDVDFNWENFRILCPKDPRKKMLASESEFQFTLNNCWESGKLLPIKDNTSFNLSFEYIFKRNKFFIDTSVFKANANSKLKTVEYSAYYLKSFMSNLYSVDSKEIYFKCLHPEERTFDVRGFVNECLNEFSIYPKDLLFEFFYKNEVLKSDAEIMKEILVDGKAEDRIKKTKIIDKTLRIHAQESSLVAKGNKIVADFDSLRIDDVNFFGVGLFNLDLECNKDPKFSQMNTYRIVNTCLENAILNKREDINELSRAKFAYKTFEPGQKIKGGEQLFEVTLDLKSIVTQPTYANLDFDLFKMVYAGDSFHYEIYFPNTQIKCQRKNITYKKDEVKLIAQCFKNSEIKTKASLIDSPFDGFKFYFSPLTLRTNNGRMSLYTDTLQYIDEEFHTNILKLQLNCAEKKAQLGKGVQEIVEGCLIDGIGKIDTIANIDHYVWLRSDLNKSYKKLFENYTDDYLKGKNPLRFDDMDNNPNLWDLKNLVVKIRDGKLKLTTDVKFAILPSWLKGSGDGGIIKDQRFKIEMEADSYYNIDEDKTEWLVMNVKKAKISKLFAFINGKQRRNLLFSILSSIVPEEMVQVNKKCLNEEEDKFKCYEIRIKMN